MADAKKVPMRLSDFSIIDEEFGSIREKFDAEMKKMEEEMTKFRSELMNRESKMISSHKTTSSQRSEKRSESTSVSSSTNGSTLMPNSFGSSPSSWLAGLESPLIQDSAAGNEKELKLRFDVSQYKPDEIVVKTVDNKLQVHAKHEEKSDSRSVYREYNREFLLPSGTDPELIKSSLSKDGVLTVEAPLPQAAITEK